VTPTLKAIFQYLVILSVTALLIWFSLRNLEISPAQTGYKDKWDYLVTTWQGADKGWLFLMAVIAIASHILRAERWRMLIAPSGNRTKLGYSFLSLMVGYLVNLVVPRGGEISRCYNLYKLDQTPVEVSFGTVVTERVVDVICLLTLVALAFAVESEKLFLFVQKLPVGTGDSRLQLLAYIFVGLLVAGFIFWWLYMKSARVNSIVKKMWKGFREGVLSVFKLERKGLFIFYSVMIWVLYFIMSYTVIKAFPETSALGLSAVLSLFAIGSIAMAVPLPGGTGSYHVLVPQGLVFLYSIPPANAVAFTFIFHGWQTAIMIAGGAISLIVTSALVKRTSKKK
jgi:glycosyltransferase 2 family protein